MKENENENKNKKRRDKQRFSSEYAMLSILEYLCMNSLTGPISKYHIITKIPGIKQQRQDRITVRNMLTWMKYYNGNTNAQLF